MASAFRITESMLKYGDVCPLLRRRKSAWLTCSASVDPQGRNAKYFLLMLSDTHSCSQPYKWDLSTKSYPGTSFKTQAFVVTTRALRDGEEIPVDDGASYYHKHGLL